MSRSHNQNSCGRGCSVCGIGETADEKYRLEREAELLAAGLDEIEYMLREEAPYYGDCGPGCRFCWGEEPPMSVDEINRQNTPSFKLGDRLLVR